MNGKSACLFLAAIICLAGCLDGGGDVDPPDVSALKTASGSQSIKECEGIETPEIRDACIRDVAVRKGDELACIKISDPREKDRCYMQNAVLKKDKSICGSIQGAVIRDSCMKKT